MGKKLLAGIAALALVLGIAFASPFDASQPQPNNTAPADVAQQQGGAADEGGAAGDEPAPDGDGDASSSASENSSGTALAASAPASSTLTATFLDAGQGDCCIIR